MRTTNLSFVYTINLKAANKNWPWICYFSWKWNCFNFDTVVDVIVHNIIIYSLFIYIQINSSYKSNEEWCNIRICATRIKHTLQIRHLIFVLPAQRKHIKYSFDRIRYRKLKMNEYFIKYRPSILARTMLLNGEFRKRNLSINFFQFTSPQLINLSNKLRLEFYSIQIGIWFTVKAESANKIKL